MDGHWSTTWGGITIRIIGCIGLGFLLALCNLYIALRLGFLVGAAIFGALTLAGVTASKRLIGRSARPMPAADQACWLSLMTGMSYGSATVIASALAAVLLLPERPASPLALTAWVAGLCGLGSCLAWPLSASLLARHPFPSGKVAGNLVLRLNEGARVDRFFWIGTLTAAGLLLQQLFRWPARQLQAWGLQIAVSPMLVGLGALLGLRTTFSMFLGALLFFVIWPALGNDLPKTPWLAMGMLVGASLPILRHLPASLGEMKLGGDRRSLFAALSFSLLLLLSGYLGMGMGVAALFLLVPLILLLTVVSCTVTGQTDVVPTGALGKLAILSMTLFGLDTGAQMVHVGTATGAAAAASDFSNDLRCAQVLSCPTERLFPFQFTGALLGAVCLVPITLILAEHVPLGGELLPVPAARIWLAVATLPEAMQQHGGQVIAGAILGLLGQLLLDRKGAPSWVPFPLPLAMAAVLDFATCSALLLGGVFARFAQSRDGVQVCCAFIAAESLVNLGLLLSF